MIYDGSRGHYLELTRYRTTTKCYIPNVKHLSLAILDKKISKLFYLKCQASIASGSEEEDVLNIFSVFL